MKKKKDKFPNLQYGIDHEQSLLLRLRQQHREMDEQKAIIEENIEKNKKRIAAHMKVLKGLNAELTLSPPILKENTDKPIRSFFRDLFDRNEKESIWEKWFGGTLLNSFWWSDKRYLMRKIFRFPIRVVEYAPILWGTEEWDFAYFLTMIEFQLNRMQKSMDGYSPHVGKEERARDMRRVIEHIKRYREVEKYTITVDTDEYLNNSGRIPLENGMSQMVNKDEELAKKHFIIHSAQHRLEQFHFQEIWRLIGKLSQGWWH